MNYNRNYNLAILVLVIFVGCSKAQPVELLKVEADGVMMTGDNAGNVALSYSHPECVVPATVTKTVTVRQKLVTPQGGTFWQALTSLLELLKELI